MQKTNSKSKMDAEAVANSSDEGGNPTTEVTLWLDIEVLAKFKAYGDDWQTRINDTLLDAIKRGVV